MVLSTQNLIHAGVITRLLRVFIVIIFSEICPKYRNIYSLVKFRYNPCEFLVFVRAAPWNEYLTNLLNSSTINLLKLIVPYVGKRPPWKRRDV